MTTFVLRSIPFLKFRPQKNVWLLARNISCINFHPALANPPNKIFSPHSNYNYTVRRLQSTEKPPQSENLNPPATQSETSNSPVTLQQKLKKAVAEYGSTVIVFHVGISLLSLGVCYVLVSSGIDGEKMMTTVGISGETALRIATNAGTFAVAYAVHKVFAPVRIMVTLTATPFIVQYLRRIGILKRVK